MARGFGRSVPPKAGGDKALSDQGSERPSQPDADRTMSLRISLPESLAKVVYDRMRMQGTSARAVCHEALFRHLGFTERQVTQLLEDASTGRSRSLPAIPENINLTLPALAASRLETWAKELSTTASACAVYLIARHLGFNETDALKLTLQVASLRAAAYRRQGPGQS